jgi:hypothetical protein
MLRVGGNETAKITLNRLIDAFGLPIRFWVVASAQFQVGARGTEDRLPKLASENGITVRDQGLRHTVEAKDVVDEEISNLTCCVWVLDRDKVSLLCEFIDDDENAIELARCRQSFDEIHGGHFPRH